ncbi:type III secretion system export apparatus subunit SctT [Edwardsiella anguillarum]|nr:MULTISPECIES: type III secretion system export apparatus subunit SctT [Edwardsiella]KAB0588212.1 EscT/YscT/HrcT family type III secretion system export apparatus protein [Edwardsiella anguillarum]MDA6076750.1 type III secretion system export apparatus subunit SctT [Edwardsiella anguillarum]RFT03456.1 EscT/YscT/HrcT family type III secretion system export apparatus protein [Edwardsiella anguillarum]UBU94761.1 type III secretion system export apparatus subunit SctT [Edwardsiella sp. LADL05-105
MKDTVDIIITIFICILRPLGAFLIIPIFSLGNFLSPLIRNAFTLAISLPIIHQNINITEVMPHEISSLSLFVLKELMIGFFIGLSFTIIFWAIDSASQLIDTLRGSTIASILNPAINDSSSVTGVFLYHFVNIIFIIHGGIEDILSTLYSSYQTLPISQSIEINGQLISFIYSLWNSFLKLLVSFSIPMIVGILLTDIAFGFLNKTAQQLNVFTLSLPIKSLIAFFILIIVLHTYPSLVKEAIALNKNLITLLLEKAI